MNALRHETSPYLLQHARNPVDWYAWKPEALARARAEDKPILVSIGYSTCHWCHVMERESFEKEEVAALMNEYFVCIKVDREERPDVDAIYMEACQIISGSGGWPLNAFLTPDGRCFYAGTYFPPRPAFNRPSWTDVLRHMAMLWAEQRDKVEEQADRLLDHIRRNDDVFVEKIGAGETPAAPFAPELADNIFRQMRERFDRAEGGFGGAPKFPSTLAIRYLLQYHWFTGQPEALEHALFSLERMIRGGIYDQLGGGFARYATDREWLAPHFEKMLYDNALLVTVMSDAYKLLDPDHPTAVLLRETIGETLRYVERDLGHPEGGFYSAEDADSEGVEGKFYVWSKAEIETVLGDGAPLFCDFYDVTEAGNWEHANILRRLQSFESFAAAREIPLEDLKRALRSSREKLLAVRARRIRPGLDDKILLGWNALMASAYAAAFTALGHPEYRDAAVRNVEFLLDNMTASPPGPLSKGEGEVSAIEGVPPSPKESGPGGEAFHTWKNGRAQYAAFLDDYAFFIAALLDVYQIGFDDRFLTLAGKYTEHVFSYFQDPDTGLFFYTAAHQDDVVMRKKDLYDNATPSGNSTMAHNLQQLGILLDQPDWREHAARMLNTLRGTVERYPLSFERWASALLNEIHPLHEIAVVGENARDKAVALQRGFLPNKVIAAAEQPDDSWPLLAGKPGEPDALIYVCRNFACQRPIRTFDEFRALTRPD